MKTAPVARKRLNSQPHTEKCDSEDVHILSSAEKGSPMKAVPSISVESAKRIHTRDDSDSISLRDIEESTDQNIYQSESLLPLYKRL